MANLKMGYTPYLVVYAYFYVLGIHNHVALCNSITTASYSL